MKSHKMFVAGLVIVMLLLTGAKCKGSPGQKPKPKDKDHESITCKLTANYPHRSRTDKDYVDGKATLRCSGGTVDKLTVTAVLEISNGGGAWRDLPAAPGWKPVETGVKVNAGSARTAAAGYPCEKVKPGDRFRTRASAEATADGKPVKIIVEGRNPNPPDGIEVACT